MKVSKLFPNTVVVSWQQTLWSNATRPGLVIWPEVTGFGIFTLKVRKKIGIKPMYRSRCMLKIASPEGHWPIYVFKYTYMPSYCGVNPILWRHYITKHFTSNLTSQAESIWHLRSPRLPVSVRRLATPLLTASHTTDAPEWQCCLFSLEANRPFISLFILSSACFAKHLAWRITVENRAAHMPTAEGYDLRYNL